jgi:predicted homoserine dehydrogenase-like protein
VAAKAKKDLKKGSVLDIIGGSDFFGFAIDHQEMKDKDYAPVGLVEKSLLKKDVKKDAIISFDAIECKKDNIVFKLY